MGSLPVEIVPEPDGIRPYIMSSWLQSYQKSPWMRDVSTERYYEGQRSVIEALLAQSEVHAAVWKESPDQIYGWICFEPAGHGIPPIIHYCYVKSMFRQSGLGRLLLKSTGYKRGIITATHYTWVCGPTGFLRHKLGVSYDPFWVRENIL